MTQTTFSLDEATIAYLTGRSTGRSHPFEITDPNGGGKFTPEGQVLPFPGNTFLCHIDQTSRAYAALCQMQDALMQGPQARHFAFLPKPSFHMTVFSGISGRPLGVDGWPADLPQDASLDACNTLFQERLADCSFPEKMRVDASYLRGGYSLRIQPADEAQESTLRGMRDQLRDITGLNRPNHADYGFHITLAYPTAWMDEDDARAVVALSNQLFATYQEALTDITLGPVEFCVMDNMYEFRPLALLTSNGLEPPNKCA